MLDFGILSSLLPTHLSSRNCWHRLQCLQWHSWYSSGWIKTEEKMVKWRRNIGNSRLDSFTDRYCQWLWYVISASWFNGSVSHLQKGGSSNTWYNQNSSNGYSQHVRVLQCRSGQMRPRPFDRQVLPKSPLEASSLDSTVVLSMIHPGNTGTLFVKLQCVPRFSTKTYRMWKIHVKHLFTYR